MINVIISYVASVLLLLGWAIARKNLTYSAILNMIGSALMSYYGFAIGALALPLLNIPYGLIALYFIIKRKDSNEEK